MNMVFTCQLVILPYLDNDYLQSKWVATVTMVLPTDR